MHTLGGKTDKNLSGELEGMHLHRNNASWVYNNFVINIYFLGQGMLVSIFP